MDELDPMKLYYELTREAYGKGYGSVNNYNPFEENYEALIMTLTILLTC